MRILVTGGCGFIGCNTAHRLRDQGHEVTLLDDLSRAGSQSNLAWLQRDVPFPFAHVDIRDSDALGATVARGRFDAIIHLAAQVAVTTSVVDPRRDFEINALGTFNLLEAVRQFSPDTIVLNASTNKVYGHLDDLEIREEGSRYTLPDLPEGIAETRSLDFHSPYGCSKGAADQYVIDYGRIYGLRTVNLRQSCIYGCRQFGVEDQGWIAWFSIAHLLHRPITIFGTGKQVRDVLFVDDLVDCYLAAIRAIDRVAGSTFNIGGGRTNSLSLLEFVDYLGEISGRKVKYSVSDWRPGDQPVYISNIGKADDELDWRPRVNYSEGIRRLNTWVTENRGLFSETALQR